MELQMLQTLVKRGFQSHFKRRSQAFPSHDTPGFERPLVKYERPFRSLETPWETGTRLFGLDNSVLSFWSGPFRSLDISVWGHFGHDISVHKRLIPFVYWNEYIGRRNFTPAYVMPTLFWGVILRLNLNFNYEFEVFLFICKMSIMT